jgi:hypothetical protein
MQQAARQLQKSQAGILWLTLNYLAEFVQHTTSQVSRIAAKVAGHINLIAVLATTQLHIYLLHQAGQMLPDHRTGGVCSKLLAHLHSLLEGSLLGLCQLAADILVGCRRRPVARADRQQQQRINI